MRVFSANIHDKPTLHDSAENVVEECNSVTVTLTVYCDFSKTGN